MDNTKKVIDTLLFYEKHKKFTSELTWTKTKYALLKELEESMPFVEGTTYISSNRDSNTTRVHGNYHFTFFRVPPKQTGYMLPLRGRMVLMICTGRDKFTHYLKISPIDFDENQIKELVRKKRLKKYLYYTDTLDR